jgi:hypothetical protein
MPETAFCTIFREVVGASSPQRAVTSRLVATVLFGLSRR